MRRIMVPIERERVIGIQPAKVKVAALFRFANGNHMEPYGAPTSCRRYAGILPAIDQIFYPSFAIAEASKILTNL